jgi:hypothetical protein
MICAFAGKVSLWASYHRVVHGCTAVIETADIVKWRSEVGAKRLGKVNNRVRRSQAGKCLPSKWVRQGVRENWIPLDHAEVQPRILDGAKQKLPKLGRVKTKSNLKTCSQEPEVSPGHPPILVRTASWTTPSQIVAARKRHPPCPMMFYFEEEGGANLPHPPRSRSSVGGLLLVSGAQRSGRKEEQRGTESKKRSTGDKRNPGRSVRHSLLSVRSRDRRSSQRNGSGAARIFGRFQKSFWSRFVRTGPLAAPCHSEKS